MARAVCRCRCVVAGTGSRVGAELAPVPRPGLAPARSPRNLGPVASCPSVPVCPPRRCRTMCPVPSSTPSPPDRSRGIDRPHRWPAAPPEPRELAGVLAHGSRTSPVRICASWGWRIPSVASRACWPYGTDRDPAQPARAAGWRGGGLLPWFIVIGRIAPAGPARTARLVSRA